MESFLKITATSSVLYKKHENQKIWITADEGKLCELVRPRLYQVYDISQTLNFLVKFLLDWKQFPTFFMNIEYVTKNEWEIVQIRFQARWVISNYIYISQKSELPRIPLYIINIFIIQLEMAFIQYTTFVALKLLMKQLRWNTKLFSSKKLTKISIYIYSWV